jgi:hypothetical protein
MYLSALYLFYFIPIESERYLFLFFLYRFVICSYWHGDALAWFTNSNSFYDRMWYGVIDIYETATITVIRLF